MSRTFLPAAVAVALCLAAAAPASAGDVSCRLSFDMSGWSVFYKTASGTGHVRCSNGQAMAVRISAKGGGLTVGKSEIRGGRGEFSSVRDIRELLGTYVAAEAHAGAVKSSKAQAMTKGDVSLALAGTGEGWDLGVAFGAFTLKAR
jgi:predicted Zn-dependent protease